jgi:hypothetical protein
MGLGLPEDFRELFGLLNANDVSYLLVGGYAVGNYGYSRATNDIDIFVASDPENAHRLVKALSEFGFGESALDHDIFLKKNSLVVLGVEPLAIDILNYLAGIDFTEAYSRRVMVDDEGLEIGTISLDDLLTNKRATGRLKDLADVEYLERINRKPAKKQI